MVAPYKWYTNPSFLHHAEKAMVIHLTKKILFYGWNQCQIYKETIFDKRNKENNEKYTYQSIIIISNKCIISIVPHTSIINCNMIFFGLHTLFLEVSQNIYLRWGKAFKYTSAYYGICRVSLKYLQSKVTKKCRILTNTNKKGCTFTLGP
jgi:hypothetical protein